MSNTPSNSTVTLGWAIDPAERRELLEMFAPAYARVVADHVTLRPGADPDDPLPPPEVGQIIGRVDDEKGVEAMIVSVGGTSDRPGGGTYHITWSLAEGRRAIESNDAIAALGWAKLPNPVPVRLEPARWPRGRS